MASRINDRLVPLKEVQAMVGLSTSEIYRRIRCRDTSLRFPAPIKLGRVSRWKASELQDWIERQSASSAPN